MRKIEEILLATNKVPDLAIRSARAKIGDDNDELLKYFLSNGQVSEKDIYQAYAKVNKLEYISLRGRDIPADILSILSSSFCRAEKLIPIEARGETLFVATPYPDNFKAMDEISASTIYTVSYVITSPSELQEALNLYFRSDDEIGKLSEEIEQITNEEEDDVDDLGDMDTESPVVRFVNLLIAQAIQDRASDIHVEPGEKELIVRYRIDGVMHKRQRADKGIQNGVVSRLKIMSDIDIGERRKPQDGRMSVRHDGKSIDIRVVTLPTSWGEKVVMRILDHDNERKSISTIGMSEKNEEIFKKHISKPHGMILVTGPTGSGKSLPLETKIPTPDGFTTMEEIAPGDKIFGGNGKVYSVTSISEVIDDAEMYEVSFSDGQKVIADADHQWLVSTASGRSLKNKRKNRAVKKYVDSHKALTKMAYLSLEFTSEFGSRTADEILSLVQKEGINYYSSPKAIAQSLHMVNVVGQNGLRPVDDSEKTVKILEYPIEDALMGLALRMREQHSVIEAVDTPVVRITTREMLENGLFADKDKTRKNYAVPVNGAIELPEKDLLIDPYLFGLWLGDGHKDSGRITIGKEDQKELLSNIESIWGANISIASCKGSSAITATMKRQNSDNCIYGHNNWVEVGKERKYNYCQTCGTSTRNTSRRAQSPVNGSLGELLAHLKVRNNKHIPMDYLRASFDQRLSLLQGLIDSDGYVSKTGNIELSFADKTLTKHAVRLIRSLGIKASVRYNKSGSYKNKDGNRIFGIRHRISFTTDLKVARLTRKKMNIPNKLRATSQWNYVTNIKPLEKTSAKCISVNSPDFTYLVGDGFVTTSNSTTIYTALGEVSKPTVNVVTVEDPVEKKIAGISQMQINNKAGMTFSNALRSILRADPDIVFLGEIRDEETAKIAVDASMTGHLVLSTLHTNGAPEAAARLTEMGVEPYLVASSVSCVVAQRLARRLCNDCKVPVETDTEALEKAGFPYSNAQLYKPVGCSLCANTGYKGRVALTEVLEIDERIEQEIIAQKTASEIRRKAEAATDFVSLKNDGWDKVAQGLTTIEEILRVAA